MAKQKECQIIATGNNEQKKQKGAMIAPFLSVHFSPPHGRN
jgi:hypothetical protein